MGSCVSVHKDPDSVTKLRFSIGSKNEKLLIPSPVKEKQLDTVNVGDRTVSDVKSQRFPVAGSKDEAFFDSQPWLESDCEDDFLSVNGDFTPSRGSTPVHHNFTLGNLLVDEEETPDSVPETSPSDKKMRLSELFKESLRDQYVDDEASAEANGAGPANRTPYFSGANSEVSSERTPSRVLRGEDRSFKSPQCCLPKLLSSRSFSERKKKTSPALSVA